MKKPDRPTRLPTNLSSLSVKFVVDQMDVIEWCPGDNAVLKAEQVHIILHLPSLGGYGAIRLKTRAAAEALIDALRVHTNGVWPVS